MLPRRRSIGPVAAALVALLMLGYASVRSTLMQAVGMPASSAAVACADPGMSMPGMSHAARIGPERHAGHAPGQGVKHPAACPYCAAAAVSAVMAGVTAPRIPTSFVFVVFHPVESHGPRGPPAFEARARGPPVVLTPA
jgi:hypothetical protein